ncbi:hypothetical protein PG993_012120 [Apiospora rasikravindrae]|uniref:Uncharacterized protein n=1 Tax=Apiospora rasikravindrae TaxID=990691 RepID=A0ABR1S1J6_9PEZI
MKTCVVFEIGLRMLAIGGRRDWYDGDDRLEAEGYLNGPSDASDIDRVLVEASNPTMVRSAENVLQQSKVEARGIDVVALQIADVEIVESH